MTPERERQIEAARETLEAARRDFEAAQKEFEAACMASHEIGPQQPDGESPSGPALKRYRRATEHYREVLQQYTEILLGPPPGNRARSKKGAD